MAEEIPANLRDQQKRDLEIHVEARNLGPLAAQKKVALATLGGEASAPFPLAYFSSGIAF